MLRKAKPIRLATPTGPTLAQHSTADGAADPDADGAAEPEAAGEVLGAALTAGDGDAADFCVRRPPWPPRRP